VKAKVLLACFVFARRFAGWGQPGWTIYSTVTALALLMMFFLSSVGFSQVEGLVDLAGLFQRITLAIGWLWLTQLAVYFLRASSEIPATK